MLSRVTGPHEIPAWRAAAPSPASARTRPSKTVIQNPMDWSSSHRVRTSRLPQNSKVDVVDEDEECS